MNIKDDFFDNFVYMLDRLNVDKGDRVYVASDMTGIMFYVMKKYNIRNRNDRDEFTDKFIDVLITRIGDEGTLLLPVFSWDFCRNKEYDYLNTKGETGSLGNWILVNRKDFIRTRHPIYSFMVWGAGRDELFNMENKSCWGEDSPFSWMHRNRAKLLMIDVTSEQCNTFEHYVEQRIHVPYRYRKDFEGDYKDENGNVTKRIYNMYVRDLDIISKQISNEQMYVDAGCLKIINEDWGRLAVIDLAESYQVCASDLLVNGGHGLYDFESYNIDWSVFQTHEDYIITEV